MNANRKLKLQLLIQNGVFAVLLLALAAGIAWVTRDIKTQWDLTQGGRNTLSPAAADVLKQLQGPVKVHRPARAAAAGADSRRAHQR